MKLLEVNQLTKIYGKRTVVADVDFEVCRGEIVGLLGPNGAGKTTAFRMTTGIVTPDDGKVFFNGEDVSQAPMHLRARKGMGYLAQEPSIFQRLTVEENILAVLEARKLDAEQRNEITESVLDELGISRLAKSLAYTLSGGERRRLELARTLSCNPTLILLDEPFSGVDPIAVFDIQEIIYGLKEKGIGVLLTDHNVRETLSITDRAYIMDNGRIVSAGTPGEILSDPTARKAYLGERFNLSDFRAPEWQRVCA